MSSLRPVLSEAETLDLFNEMDLKFLKKGTLLSEHGKPSGHIVFVLSGGFRMWQLSSQGADSTIELSPPGSFAFDYFSFISQLDSEMNVEAVHESEVLMLSHSRLEQLYRSRPLFERISRLLTQHAYLLTIKRFRRDLTQTPQENYETTLRLRPELFEYFPQYMIASYLGVGPEWLSRIRSKSASKANY